MTIRSTRYRIYVEYKDGRPADCAQANSRRTDAVRRAQVIRETWPSAARVYILDARTGETLA